MVMWGIPLAFLAVEDSFSVTLVILAVVGVANTVFDVASFTLLQRAVADEVLARVFGILETVILGTMAVGGLAASALIEAIGLSAALVATGLFLPVSALLLGRSLLAVDAQAAAPDCKLAFMRGVAFLGLLPPTVLEALARNLRTVRVAAHEPVFSQGDKGDRFYVIAEGTAEVAVDSVPRQTLVAGDSFGEIALLRDVPRTASVVAANDLVLYALERHDFLAAVAVHEPARQAATAVAQARLGTA
jgi:Cyclic nucleotide-binding domain